MSNDSLRSIGQNAAGSFPGVTFRNSEVQREGRYVVFAAGDWQTALSFLRTQDVKEPSLYYVVETPEGNIGKDLIAIFDESNGEILELAERRKLPTPQRSKTHCSLCGFFVIPMDKELQGPNVRYYFSLEDLKNRGTGLYCARDQIVVCAHCATLVEASVVCPFCGGSMQPHRE